MDTTEIGTIINRYTESRGAGGYWFITNDKLDKTARINNKEFGEIKTCLSDLAEDGITDLKDALLRKVCLWSKKKTFLNDLKLSGISNEEAFNFMLSQTGGAKVAIGKSEAEKVASILISVAPNLSPDSLYDRLLSMLVEHRTEALGIVKTMLETNGRDNGDTGWIYTTTLEERQKLKSYKSTPATPNPDDSESREEA